MRTSTRATSEGFTLVELTLVLLILGILLSLTVPRLTLLAEAHLDSAARRLATMMSYLQDEAALRGRVYKMTFDLDADSYAIEVQTPYQRGPGADRYADRWDPYAKSSTMPDDVDLVEVADATGTHTSGSFPISFLPETSLGTFTVVLAASSGRTLELTVDRVTGDVAIDTVVSAGAPG